MNVESCNMLHEKFTSKRDLTSERPRNFAGKTSASHHNHQNASLKITLYNYRVCNYACHKHDIHFDSCSGKSQHRQWTGCGVSEVSARSKDRRHHDEATRRIDRVTIDPLASIQYTPQQKQRRADVTARRRQVLSIITSSQLHPPLTSRSCSWL